MLKDYLYDLLSSYKIEVEVLSGGLLPSKAHANDAGFDVYATDDVVVYPGMIVKHPLNIKMRLPKGSWARIETKSGLGSKGLLVYAGVIDEGYTGIVHAILTNLNHGSKEPIVIKEGQKIAQMTMNNHSNRYYIKPVRDIVSNTSRGSAGFGSSGL